MSVERIRRRLKSEGYGDREFQLAGREIRRRLRKIVAVKRAQMAGRASREGELMRTTENGESLLIAARESCSDA